MIKMAYRPEIDFLRAIAVLSVIVYHFSPHVLPLGYLGVDIFFVISGFLISQQILSSIMAEQFSMRDFYIRRAKRILPLTLFVVIITLALALALYTPYDLKKVASSAIGTLTFTANIFFWRDGGYFGSSDELKPLLHTWSLSVEEQFYIVFPLFMVILAAISKRVKLRDFLMFAAIAFSIVILISFLLNVFFLFIGASNPAFFMLPTRAWQFLIGGLTATIFMNRDLSQSKLTICAALMLFGFGFYFTHPLIPLGLLVSFAACLFLSCSFSGSSLFRYLLINPISGYLGKISFSLYLWHWPIAVFFKYTLLMDSSVEFLAIGFALTLILSALTYEFVEKPFRNKFSNAHVIKTLVVLAFVILGTSLVILKNDGFPGRVIPAVQSLASANQTNYRCEILDYRSYGASRACILNQYADNPYSVALFGNSHAQMYAPSLMPYLESHGEQGILIPLNGCMPTTELNISVECVYAARTNLAAILGDDQIKTVIISTTWYDNAWVNEKGDNVPDRSLTKLQQSMSNLITNIKSSGKDVFLVSPIQIPRENLSSALSRELMFSDQSYNAVAKKLYVDRSIYDREFSQINEYFRNLLGDNYIDIASFFCDEVFCRYGTTDLLYFADASHIGRQGANFVSRGFLPVFSNRSAR